MEKKKFNFKKLGIVLCVCFITLFAFIPFANFNKIGSVYAASDEVSTTYTYKSSNLYIPVVRSPYIVDYLVLKISLTGGEQVYIDFDCDLFYFGGYNNNPEVGNFEYLQDLIVYGPNYTNVNRRLTCSTSKQNAWFYITHNVPADYLFCFYYTGNFNGNVKRVRLDSYVEGEIGFNRVTFYSSVSDYLVLAFSCGKFTNSEAMLSTRDYYLSDPSTFSDNEIYQSGYNDGYNVGNGVGNSSGYTDGYNTGLTEGYNNGYNTGINDSNQYSFYNLFGAVIDAPIKVFSGLFNFNLLGINLLGLITGLFTLAMIILILKLVFGGK